MEKFGDLDILVGEKLGRLMYNLDDKSKKIIWHLFRNRHARITNLTEAIEESSDSNTLVRIRDVINQLSNKILGSPILCFEEGKVDFYTGNKILFSWWLNEEVVPVETYETNFDVFDEKDKIRMVFELKGVAEEEIKLFVKGNILNLKTNKLERSFPLLYSVNKNPEKTFRNGVLEVNLRKINYEK